MAVSEHELELLADQQREEVGSHVVGLVRQRDRHPLLLDDQGVVTRGQGEQFRGRPPLHRPAHAQDRVRHPRLAGIGGYRLAVRGQRLQSGVHRFLGAVGREQCLHPEVGQPKVVGRHIEVWRRLVEQSVQQREVADEQGRVGGFEVQLTGSFPVDSPAIGTEQVQPVATVAQRQGERGLGAGPHRCLPEDVGEDPSFVVVLGQGPPADATWRAASTTGPRPALSGADPGAGVPRDGRSRTAWSGRSRSPCRG